MTVTKQSLTTLEIFLKQKSEYETDESNPDLMKIMF